MILGDFSDRRYRLEYKCVIKRHLMKIIVIGPGFISGAGGGPVLKNLVNLRLGFVGHKVLMHYFYKLFFHTPGHTMDQTKQVYTNDDEERIYPNSSFNNPCGRCLMLRLHPSVILFT